jgi:ketosteroid isomerase-like protein
MYLQSSSAQLALEEIATLSIGPSKDSAYAIYSSKAVGGAGGPVTSICSAVIRKVNGAGWKVVHLHSSHLVEA